VVVGEAVVELSLDGPVVDGKLLSKYSVEDHFAEADHNKL